MPLAGQNEHVEVSGFTTVYHKTINMTLLMPIAHHKYLEISTLFSYPTAWMRFLSRNFLDSMAIFWYFYEHDYP
jgi:hypothetical protein